MPVLGGRRTASGRGLACRMILTGGVMALLLIGTFVFLFAAVTGLRDADATARRSEAMLVSADRLEKLVFSLDEDTRALVLTHDPAFRQAYDADLAVFHGVEANLERLAGRDSAAEGRRVHQIIGAANAYLRGRLAPLTNTALGDAAGARATVDGGQGLRQLAALRNQCENFENTQRRAAAASERRSEDAARTAVVFALVDAAGTLLLIVFFVAYLTRVIIRPVRHAADVAGQLAEGHLAIRMPETSPGEIGRLECRFNTMVRSLETSRDRLRQVADQQRALRRVATLVACGVSPTEVFDAVAAEVGNVLYVDHTQIIRFEPDGTARTLGYWNNPGAPKVMPPLGGHWPIEAGSVTASVRDTERPARMTNYEHATSAIGIWAHAAGVQSAAGCPVKVEGRIWGAMVINSLDAEPLPQGTEAHMQEFIELVGTAIANAQSRTDLLASRARVVAASDESRRRIERDLHDGAQQRLVTLALKLRTIQSTAGPEQTRFVEQLTEPIHDLSDILNDLQEVSRGIVPPTLARSGLGPALRSLARHSPVPVELHANPRERLPEPVEVAVYYTLAEALTNIAKHAKATEVRVDLATEHQTVRLSIQDDGQGGADLHKGSGLVGLKDRIEALGGTIEITSPPEAGTSLFVNIPVEPPQTGPSSAENNDDA
jgi:signal transduction histidine kinase